MVSLMMIFLFSGCGSTVNRDATEKIADETQLVSGENEDKNRAALYIQGEVIFKEKCKACHGEFAEKSALGKSSIVAHMNEDEISYALSGYKSGTRNNYGMGGLMKGQAAPLSDKEHTALAVYIYELNVVRLNLAGKGFKVYLKKYRDECGISSADFAAQHIQQEWKTIKSENHFLEELEIICPSVTFDVKYQDYLYAFVYEYASDSGNELVE